MDIALLRYFVVVANTQHITKAAEILNISQPSLSSAIRRLEFEIGFELFSRAKRNIELNDYGKIFLESVTAAEKEISFGLNKMKELKKVKENFISLCIPTSPDKHQIMETLLSEGFTLKFTSLPDNWQRALIDNQIDLVTTIEEYSNPIIERALLRYNELAIVARRSHPLASAKHITVEDINQYPFSSSSTQHSPLVCARKQLALNGLKPHVTFFGNNTADVMYSINSSDRLGLMVKTHLPQGHNLAVLTVDNLHISLPIYLYWRIDNAKASINRIIEYIKEYYR